MHITFPIRSMRQTTAIHLTRDSYSPGPPDTSSLASGSVQKTLCYLTLLETNFFICFCLVLIKVIHVAQKLWLTLQSSKILYAKL